MEYYSAIKNEILPFAVTWIDLESIILNKVRPTEKHKYHIISLINLKNKINKTHRFREQIGSFQMRGTLGVWQSGRRDSRGINFLLKNK